MSNLPFHHEQLEFMTDLASRRVEFLDPVFRFLNYFDSPYFFFVLIPTVWLGFSYRWGLRLFYWFTANNLVIQCAKNAVGWPRPSTEMPEIGLFHPTSFGFPSGGAQTAMFLGGLLLYYRRTPAAWAIGLIYILLISFSRLYLGVHYPIDILGGWILGVGMLALFVASREPLETWLVAKGPFFSLSLSLAIPLAILIAFPNTRYPMGSAVGIALGTYFSLKYRLFIPSPKTLAEGIGRSFIGTSILFMILLLIPDSQSFGASFIAGLFMSLAASPICRWFVKRNDSRRR